MERRTNIRVRLRNADVEVEFIVCLSFTARVMLGADFCDQHVYVTHPKHKCFSMDDSTAVTIVRHPGKRAVSQTPLQSGLEHAIAEGIASLLVRDAWSIVTRHNLNEWINSRTEHNGLMVMQSITSVYDTHAVAVANGLLMVKPNVHCQILVAIFSDTSKQLKKKNQKIWWAQR